MFCYALTACNLGPPQVAVTITVAPWPSSTQYVDESLSLKTLVPTEYKLVYLSSTPSVTMTNTSTLIPSTSTQIHTSTAIAILLETATQANVEESCELEVTTSGGNLNIRQAPGNATLVLKAVPSNSRFKVVGRTVSGEWFAIDISGLAIGKEVGWVLSNLVITEGVCDAVSIYDIPIINVSPTTQTMVEAPSINAYTNPSQDSSNDQGTVISRSTNVPTAVPRVESGMDIARYCREVIGYAGARPEDENEPNSWICYDDSGNTRPVDFLGNMCAWHYEIGTYSQPLPYLILVPPSNAWSWKCTNLP